ncbi:MAG: NAD(P)-dependent oxidoreductase [Rhodospirillales bacterium]
MGFTLPWPRLYRDFRAHAQHRRKQEPPMSRPLSGRTVGFIGLGLMGLPMARNLLTAGADLKVYNRSEGPREKAAAEGMTAAASPAEAARGAEAVIIMTADTPAVEAVLLGGDGALEGVSPGALVIDMGTTAVLETRGFAAAAEAKGADYVDAPVSGGVGGAEQAALSIMAGGTDAAFAQAKPFFDVLGRNVTHVGPAGCGQIAKAANQVIVGLTIGAVAEALALAEHAGADPAKVRGALQGGFADSRILEIHGQRMLDKTFAPGARVTMQRKDLNQALALAEAVGLNMPATALNRDLYDALIEAGHGGLDHSALIKTIDPKA